MAKKVVRKDRPKTVKLFKNWKAIGQIQDQKVMWALALLDLASDFGMKLATQLPEYFSKKPHAQTMPIPASRLLQEAIRGEVAKYQRPQDGPPALSCDGALQKFDIPFQYFRGPQNDCFEWDPIPAEIARQVGESWDMGQVLEWEGKKVIVVENAPGEFLCISPAELIALDIPLDELNRRELPKK